MADLLSREGHPLADQVVAARTESKEPEGIASARRTLGVAAGAVIVLGSVVAGVLGLNNGPDPSPTAAAGEPVGALPGKGAPAQPGEAPAAGPVSQQFTNAAVTETLPQASPDPAGEVGEIGRPASVKPPASVQAPRATQPVARKAPPAPNNPAPAAPAPQQAPAGLVQSVTEPVTEAVGSPTLSGIVAPVTSTVDDTLQPALSLIGGLLGR